MRTQDFCKFVAFEGGSLTFLGLVKYDSASDNFQMTQLSTILAGGVTEAKRCIAERLVYLNEIKYAFLFTSIVCLGGCAFIHYANHQERKAQA